LSSPEDWKLCNIRTYLFTFALCCPVPCWWLSHDSSSKK